MTGGQFFDRILPIEGNRLSSDVWGLLRYSHDFYAWAMADNAAITMSEKKADVTVDGKTVSLPIADYISNGINRQDFNGCFAFTKSGSDLDLRNKGVNNAYSGLFDYNHDCYFSVLNLKAGDKVIFVITGEDATFPDGKTVVSENTYIVEPGQSKKTIKCVYYSTIKSVKIESKITSEK